MSAPFTAGRCSACGHLAHPPRILCPECGAPEWAPAPLPHGTVTEVTVRRPVFERRQLPSGDWVEQEAVRLAAVRAEAGGRAVRVIARAPADVEPGDRVTLAVEGGAAVALPASSAGARLRGTS